MLWLYLHDNVAIYSSKYHLITSLSSLIFHFPSWCTILSYSIYFFRHLLYLRVHVLSTESSSILFGVLSISSFNSLLFLPFRLHHQYQSPHSCIPFSYIFSPQTIILGRLSPLFLAVFRFYLFFSFSVTDTLFLFFCHISVALSFSFILIFSICIVLITVLICIFLFKFLLFERILYDIRIYLL